MEPLTSLMGILGILGIISSYILSHILDRDKFVFFGKNTRIHSCGVQDYPKDVCFLSYFG